MNTTINFSICVLVFYYLRKKKIKFFSNFSDLTNDYHKLFFHELLTLSEAEDSTLVKLDCYKNVTNLIPLRRSALRALAACHYISDNQYKDKIVNILFKVMENSKADLQEEAFKCMQQFITGYQIEKEKVRIFNKV